MNPRLLAGLGMILLAAGLLAIFFLQDGAPSLERWTAPDEEFQVPEVALADGQGPPEVARFLNDLNEQYRQLWTEARTAGWQAATDQTPANLAAAHAARRRLADYQGGPVLDQLKLFRGRLDLTAGQDRQIEMAWQDAAHHPGTRAEALNRLWATQQGLADTVSHFAHHLNWPAGESHRATPDQLEEILASSTDRGQRQAAWECRQSVGPRLKEGLVQLRDDRNILARDLGYSSYFDLQAAGFDLGSADMLELMDDLLVGIMPLYAQLHCFARHELAAKFGVAEVPALIPAHWLAGPGGAVWSGLAAADARDSLFAGIQAQWLVEQAEHFFTSQGFQALPVSFWTRSDLFPLDPGAGRNKSVLPGAWHMDLDRDVRALLNVTPTFAQHSTAHGVLGQAYYFLAYSRPEVPPLLRRPANRSFAGAMDHLARLAAGQNPYLHQLGLLETGEAPLAMETLLAQALEGPVVMLPLACGTMAHWEHDLYEKDLPRHRFNTRWWLYTARYQGIAPPAERGEDFCDPAVVPACLSPRGQAYDQALSAVIAHQLHRYICREILDQDVRTANYYGNPRLGRYLQSIMELGATRDWNLVMRQATGEDLSCDALLEYYAPLQEWLMRQNEGRQVGF